MAVDEVPRSAIIINSPYIERILAGEKTWEMRSKTCTKRESIGLIRKGSGKVVGLARVIDVKGPLTRAEILANLDKHRRSREDLDNPALAKYNIAWVLSDARPLAQPVPYKHNGSRMWVTLSEDVREEIAKQTGLMFVRGMPQQRRINAQEKSGKRNKSSLAGENRKGVDAGGCAIAIILTVCVIFLITYVGLIQTLAGLVLLGLLSSKGAFISIMKAIPGLVIIALVFVFLTHF